MNGKVKLSDVNRDIMLPRYARIDQFHSDNAVVNVNLASGAYTLINANYQMALTLTETSIIEVVFQGLFYHYGNQNQWEPLAARIINTTTATSLNFDVQADYHGAIGSNKTGGYRGLSLHGMEQLASGAYTYETQARDYLANTWRLYQGHMHIKVYRVT